VVATSVIAGVAAVAALGAAVFSGLTLLITGRRETRKWLRESLLEAQVEFLDASFRYPARQLHALIGDLPSDAVVSQTMDLSSYWADYKTAHEAQNDALTRLRLLAGDAVVRAAENLHDIDEHISLRLMGDEPYLGLAAFNELRRNQRTAREEFIKAARVGVNLSPGAPIRSSDVGRDDTLPADL
jgi:hypothetical protein